MTFIIELIEIVDDGDGDCNLYGTRVKYSIECPISWEVIHEIQMFKLLFPASPMNKT